MEQTTRRRVKFDGTVTFGNLLTLITMVGAILMMWRNMETRIVLMEERMSVQTKALERVVSQMDRYLYQSDRRMQTLEGQ